MSQVARAVLLKDGGPGEAHGGRPISRDRHTRPLNLQKAQGPTGPARPTYPPSSDVAHFAVVAVPWKWQTWQEISG